jgi:hypothetical protein
MLRSIGQPEINIIDKEKDLYELTHKDKSVSKIIEFMMKRKNAR